ncbi:hypothetical protein [Sorangium sp. So ce388]|uniref:hypothetical protein n=1 Tax=Sorangium sp. So ce388 TaxID=3133309 RepID=UPI003F5B86F8
MWTALAFDPGPTRQGVAVVSFDGRRFEMRYGAHLRFGGGFTAAGAHEPLFGAGQVDALLDDIAEARGIVVIEQIVGFAYDQYRVQALVETSRTEGRLLELARARGIEPLFLEALDVRGELCRTRKASDGQVRVVVEGMLHGIPAHLTEEQRVHIYDAAALGMVALCRVARVKMPRTPEVEAALVRQKALDEVARAAKRAKKAAGELPSEKRGLTRGQRARRRAGAKHGWETRRAP